MRARSFAPLFLASALALPACSAESKAKSVLKKYETVFKMCKDMTEELKMQPKEHDCALVSSMALDGSLEDTGAEAAALDKMRDEWLKTSGYADYYVAKADRKPEHQ